MGVYIKNMEMPINCMLCPLCVEEADPANGEMCMVTGTLMPPCTRERLDNCPLVPVPPHGRLIAEADAVETAWMILRGLGYLKEENNKLEQTVREVFATAPAIEVEEHG